MGGLQKPMTYGQEVAAEGRLRQCTWIGNAIWRYRAFLRSSDTTQHHKSCLPGQRPEIAIEINSWVEEWHSVYVFPAFRHLEVIFKFMPGDVEPAVRDNVAPLM